MEEQAAADSSTKTATLTKEKGKTMARVRRSGRIERAEILRGGVEEAGFEMVTFLIPVVEI